VTTSSPLVTVVVPVHNGERHLAETIESVRRQTYQSLEIVVIDDGSTDSSAAIARRYDGVHVISQPNGGVASSRNLGMTAGHGEFIAFLDQDDLWLPEKIAAQMALLLRDPEVGFALTMQRRFVTEGEPTPEWVRPEWIDRDLLGNDPSALLVRRATLELVGPFNPAFQQASDVDWFFRASERHVRSAVVPRALLLRRLHDANNSRFVTQTAADIRRLAMESIRRRRADRT